MNPRRLGLNTLTNPEIQRQILDSLKAHTKLEKTSGTEIYPAMRQPRPNERFAMADKRECLSQPDEISH